MTNDIGKNAQNAHKISQSDQAGELKSSSHYEFRYAKWN